VQFQTKSDFEVTNLGNTQQNSIGKNQQQTNMSAMMSAARQAAALAARHYVRRCVIGRQERISHAIADSMYT